MEYPQLAKRVELVDQERLKEMLCSRFSIAKDAFDGLVFFQSNRRLVSLVNADHMPPVGHRVQATGLPFVHTGMAMPKLTTAATFFIGSRAKRNVIDLSHDQTDAFLSRETLLLVEGQLDRCTDAGYVIVRHQGVTVGLGFLRVTDDGCSTLESYFPKSWSIEQGSTAFDGPSVRR
ncbi:MAG: hypothetical protein VX834_12500 [Myxococcota bacterium]|nr:hypothetical protein [Myxococcota bacterium]